jgi:hypothetical protein
VVGLIRIESQTGGKVLLMQVKLLKGQSEGVGIVCFGFSWRHFQKKNVSTGKNVDLRGPSVGEKG